MTSITTAQLSNNKWLIEVTFKAPIEDYSNVMPIVAIDESGSMLRDIESAEAGSRKLITAYLENNCPEVVVVRYNSSATTFTYHTLDEAANFRTRAQGMTNFPAAIREIVTAIDRANTTKRQPRVYFMTDGQNTVEGSKLPGAINTLRSALGTSKIPATIDVIGFTSSHDVKLLNSFAQMTGEGTFQYADRADTLQEIVGDLLTVSGNKRTVDLVWAGHKIRAQAIREEDGIFRVVKQVSVSPATEVKVQIAGQPPVYMPMIKKELTPETRQRFHLQNIRDTLADLVQRVNTLKDGQTRTQFDRDLREVDTQIDSLVGSGDIFRDMTREQRRLVRQTHLEFKETVAQLYNARTNNLSTSEFASLLSSTSAHVTKTGLQKKLQQRVLANMNDTDSVTARERGKTLTFTSDPVEDASCMLTLENYQELAKNGDCLCLCMSISRSQAAIADPSQVRIHKIQPSLLSLDAFRDAVEMKLINNDGTAVHGGFQHSLGKSSSVIEGLAREKINAVFPVYFDDESWAITRLHLKEALSWIATITWNGWSFSQVELLPSIILAHAIHECVTNPSEHNRVIVERLVNTCRAISDFRTDEGTLAVRHRNHLKAFMDSPVNRTIDHVPSIQALVGIAYTHASATYKDNKFFEIVWEEHFRRELRWQLSDTSEDDLMRMLAAKMHIELSKYTKINVTSGSGGVEGARIRTLLGLDADNVQEGSSQLTNEKWVWDPTVILLGDIQQAQQTWVQTNGWFPTKRDFLSTEVYLATALQNMLQSSNSSRREAHKTRGDGTVEYLCPFNNPAELIRGVGNKVIKYFRDQAWARHQASLNSDAALSFAQTDDMFQAAGLIKENINHFGNNNFHRFAVALTNPSARAIDKINMLLTGKFTHGEKTITLVSPGWASVGGPKRSWVRKWWLTNGRNLSTDETEQWNATLPDYKVDGYWLGAWTANI